MSHASNLHERAEMLFKARHFFRERNITEVDCPILTRGASVDAHIDLIKAFNKEEVRYLHSSPEYGMKRLLSEGMGDIYQLSHVFREGEVGKKHNPEFMMAEWYRLNFSIDQMIDDTCDFIELFLGKLPRVKKSYRETLHQFTGIDYVTMSENDLLHYLQEENISYYPEIVDEGKDALLNLILGINVEPHLGKDCLYIITHYPSTQAALAKKVTEGGVDVSLRFEIYYDGMELANGYHELTNATEQRKRFMEANQLRLALKKEPLPLDEAFLEALETGLPDCCGVAVGFDRLMMLHAKADSIKEVIPFDWDLA